MIHRYFSVFPLWFVSVFQEITDYSDHVLPTYYYKRKGSVVIVMRSGSLDISNSRATSSLKTFARVSPRRNY